MSYTVDVGEGFAQLLAAASLGLTWQNTGVYTSGQTGIFIGAVPPDPDTLVTLTVSDYGDDPAFADSLLMLQVRTRAGGQDPRPVIALDDSIADVLLGLWPVTLPTGPRIVTLVRASSTLLGQDANRRWGNTANYRLGAHRPSAHRQ